MSIAYSPDGRRILTSSLDRTAKLWDAVTGREVLTLKGHAAPVAAVDFAPDGGSVVIASLDGTTRIWRAAKPQQLQTWQSEEQAAAQKLQELDREWLAASERTRAARARDEGRIKRWLVLTPIGVAAATGQSGVDALDIEQVPGEANLQPTVGDAQNMSASRAVLGPGSPLANATPSANRELRWREATLDQDYTIDFNSLVGRETTQSVAYAVCYIYSEAEQHGLEMLVRSDDGAKVYLNGKQVYKSATPPASASGQDAISDITLNAGLNVLVFKVVNEFGSWQGSISLADTQGNPVKGIQVTVLPLG